MLNLVEAFKRPNCGKLPLEHGELYNKVLAPFCDKADFRMLEIGIWHGESLKVWKECFPSVTLFGLDTSLFHDEIAKICNVIIGDQAYRPFMQSTANKLRALDVVIDDGGHWADDQQVSFECLWPIIRPGGIYVIEDLWVADSRTVDGFESTLRYLENLAVRKEFYKGNNGFEKDICVLYKD